MNETTPQAHRKYDQEFKLAALDRLRTSGKSQRAVAEELGISEQNLRDWRAAFTARPPAPAGVRPRTLADVEAENLRLKREVISLRNQRDILKKSLGILSEPPTNGSRI